MKTPEEILLSKDNLDMLEALRSVERDAPDLYQEIARTFDDLEDFDAPTTADVLFAREAFPEKTYQELRDLVERNGVRDCSVKTLVATSFPNAKQLEFFQLFRELADSDYCARDDFGNEIAPAAVEAYLRQQCQTRRVFIGARGRWVVDMATLYENERDTYVVSAEARTFCRYKVVAASPAEALKTFERMTPAEREAALILKSDTYETHNVER